MVIDIDFVHEFSIYNFMVEKEFEFAKIEAEKFINFFESKGWKVGKNPMKVWKSAVANWMINYYDRNKIQTVKKSKLEVIQESHSRPTSPFPHLF